MDPGPGGNGPEIEILKQKLREAQATIQSQAQTIDLLNYHLSRLETDVEQGLIKIEHLEQQHQEDADEIQQLKRQHLEDADIIALKTSAIETWRRRYNEERQAVSTLTVDVEKLNEQLSNMAKASAGVVAVSGKLESEIARLLTKYYTTYPTLAEWARANVYGGDLAVVFGFMPTDNIGSTKWDDVADGYRVEDFLPYGLGWSNGPRATKVPHGHWPAWFYRDHNPDPPDPQYYLSGIALNSQEGSRPIHWSPRAMKIVREAGKRMNRIFGVIVDLRDASKTLKLCADSARPRRYSV